MKIELKDPPRIFRVGFDKKKYLQDCARIALDSDEQVTFVTASGAEYDVARKEWGFYATPSLNGRLKSFGLRAVLVKNRVNRYFLLLVEIGKGASFEKYLAEEQLTLIAWLDETEKLELLEAKLASS